MAVAVATAGVAVAAMASAKVATGTVTAAVWAAMELVAAPADAGEGAAEPVGAMGGRWPWRPTTGYPRPPRRYRGRC